MLPAARRDRGRDVRLDYDAPVTSNPKDAAPPLAGDGSTALAAGGLRRVISFWDASALVVGMIVGSGIFRAPASVAQHVSTASLILTVWIIGAVLSLAGGIASAELGARFPRSGGQYVFLQEAFGPSVAFAFGWAGYLLFRQR